MILLLWGGAMGVDIGFTVTSSRQAQAMADTAALDLARYINLADSQRIANYSSYINGKLANVQTDNNAGNVTFTATGEYWSPDRTGRVEDPRRPGVTNSPRHLQSRVLQSWSRRRRTCPGSLSAGTVP